ncbi:Protein of unknown function [Pyronema omphalodes CBS 100304]|uniref:C3H1-type domain-containing protein n=1 Tax=Pyronema omphalodes (strain CBS 100304) TaxID=1076935 RepID=U4L403_PYROM|nr:Protein of unknown function [Pyronema omphalodes CBS 100304]
MSQQQRVPISYSIALSSNDGQSITPLIRADTLPADLFEFIPGADNVHIVLARDRNPNPGDLEIAIDSSISDSELSSGDNNSPEADITAQKKPATTTTTTRKPSGGPSGPCKYFRTQEGCNRKDLCRFEHLGAVEPPRTRRMMSATWRSSASSSTDSESDSGGVKSGERIDCIDWLWLGDVVDINLEIRMVFIGAGTLFDKNGHMT